MAVVMVMIAMTTERINYSIVHYLYCSMPPRIRLLVMMTLLNLSHSNDQLINSVNLNASDADNDANAVNASADDDDVNDGYSVDGY